MYVCAVFVVLILLMATGCNKPVSPGGEAKPPAEELPIEDAIEDSLDAPLIVPSEDAVVLPIGLYIKTGGGKRVLQKQVQNDFVVGKDIVVLSAFLTEEPEISAEMFKKVWNAYRGVVPEASLYKIGYSLSYSLASGTAVEQIIKGPADTEANRNYIETYIYDDVNQDGWYSHLLVSDIKDETVVTSLKLTGGPDVAEVGDIAVEAFLYKAGEDSEKAGTYSVTVVRK